MRNAAAASLLVAALALGGVACDGGNHPKQQRSPTGTATSSPTKRKPSGPRQTPTKAKRTVAPAPTPTGTVAPAPSRTAPAATPTGPPSTPARSSSTGQESPDTFTPGYQQTTLDPWRRGQCENAGHTDCE